MKQLLTGGHLLFGLSTGPMLAADMIIWFDILQGWHYNIYSDCLYNNNIPFSIKYVIVHASFFLGELLANKDNIINIFSFALTLTIGVERTYRVHP